MLRLKIPAMAKAEFSQPILFVSLTKAPFGGRHRGDKTVQKRQFFYQLWQCKATCVCAKAVPPSLFPCAGSGVSTGALSLENEGRQGRVFSLLGCDVVGEKRGENQSILVLNPLVH